MKYYIISGEASGDLHASNLIRHLKIHDAKIDVRAWGGDLMQEQGATLVRHYKNIAFMGCSLGAYYALYFSQLHRSKAILINPAIPPLEGFEVYLGENENFSTREKFSITKKDIKYIRSISHDSFNNKKRTLVLLESGDEVLDYIKTISYFRGSHIDIVFGGNHSYSSFENKLVKIQKFLQIH